ncbi:MAG: methyltransferase domain-containing protein [Rhodocyclaceae bacterium]|nr:methyltransferase domain-containing protein [Rhodocyclaceae bacterium]MBK9311427.1 methyltransferase domain-containing protein [Rhodocyclaceae bacterium]MBK9956418.1 methyltransferase domain-containing protein [Rhodocyclaceae bacterium]
MAGPGKDFWQERFATGEIPWDRGGADAQIGRWIADGTLAAGSHIIVPGCGQGWEVEALAAAGMTVVGIDYAASALDRCRALLAQRSLDAELIEADVLTWQPAAPADAVLEQACLCALYPDHWQRYAAQLHRWLRPGGQLLALFMQARKDGAAEGFIEGPPYHGDINAMRALFPEPAWRWPKPPYTIVRPVVGQAELAVVLVRA